MFKILAFLLPSLALGAQSTSYPRIEADYVDGQIGVKNYILNPSCTKNTNNISIGNSASVTRNTSLPLFSPADCTVSLPNNSTGYVDFYSKPFDYGLSKGVCSTRITYKSQSMGSNVRATTYIGSTSYPSDALINSSDPVVLNTSYPCGTVDGTSYPKVRIHNNPGNSGASAIRIGRALIGEDGRDLFNRGSIISDTKNTAIESVLVASACGSSPCTANFKTNGIINVIRTATGRYTINFRTGIFTDKPACAIQHGNNPGYSFFIEAGVSSTTYQFGVNNIAGAAIDEGFSAVCQGTRP